VHRVLMVIRREYLDRVRKKSFWIGTLVFPLIMVGLLTIPMLMVRLQPDEQKKIAIVDATEKLLGPMREELTDEKFKDGRPRYLLEGVPVKGSVDETRKPLEAEVGKGALFGVLTAGTDVDAKGNFAFYSKNVGNLQVLETIQGALRKAVIFLRTERMQLGIDRAKLNALTARVEIESFQVSAAGESKKKGFLEAYLGTFGFVMILFMSMLLYGVAVMRGILEEKSNRIMEVLLGSLTPDQLMSGKILGIGLVGLTQLGVYVLTSGVIQLYALSRSNQGEMGWLLDLLAPSRLAYFVLFFLLGYFMYTALFAAVGAVCNSEQEAQNLQGPQIGRAHV